MITPRLEVTKILKEEYDNTEGFGKLFLAGIFFNIPFFGFVPLVSSVVTVVILTLFLKKYLLLVKNDDPNKASNLSTSYGPKIVIALTIITMVGQLAWIPFVTQLETLVLLGVIYAFFSKYKE